jgi:hypothetical protein
MTPPWRQQPVAILRHQPIHRISIGTAFPDVQPRHPKLDG